MAKTKGRTYKEMQRDWQEKNAGDNGFVAELSKLYDIESRQTLKDLGIDPEKDTGNYEGLDYPGRFLLTEFDEGKRQILGFNPHIGAYMNNRILMPVGMRTATRGDSYQILSNEKLRERFRQTGTGTHLGLVIYPQKGNGKRTHNQYQTEILMNQVLEAAKESEDGTTLKQIEEGMPIYLPIQGLSFEENQALGGLELHVKPARSYKSPTQAKFYAPQVSPEFDLGESKDVDLLGFRIQDGREVPILGQEDNEILMEKLEGYFQLTPELIQEVVRGEGIDEMNIPFPRKIVLPDEKEREGVYSLVVNAFGEYKLEADLSDSGIIVGEEVSSTYAPIIRGRPFQTVVNGKPQETVKFANLYVSPQEIREAEWAAMTPAERAIATAKLKAEDMRDSVLGMFGRTPKKKTRKNPYKEANTTDIEILRKQVAEEEAAEQEKIRREEGIIGKAKRTGKFLTTGEKD